jgi:hypothetical protein
MTHTTALFAAACGVTACAALALAQPYTVTWSTVDAGGVSRAEAPGFSYTVGGTAGQHDAGPAPVGPAIGGPYAVAGGFWLGAPNCLVDWDGNGVVNSTDVSNFINDWFTDQSAGTFVTDFNNDGVVNSTDVSDFISSWFAGCPAI